MQSSPIHSPAVFRAEAPPHERDMTPRVNMRTIAPRLLHPARKLTRNKQLQGFFSRRIRVFWKQGILHIATQLFGAGEEVCEQRTVVQHSKL